MKCRRNTLVGYFQGLARNISRRSPLRIIIGAIESLAPTTRRSGMGGLPTSSKPNQNRLVKGHIMMCPIRHDRPQSVTTNLYQWCFNVSMNSWCVEPKSLQFAIMSRETRTYALLSAIKSHRQRCQFRIQMHGKKVICFYHFLSEHLYWSLFFQSSKLIRIFVIF